MTGHNVVPYLHLLITQMTSERCKMIAKAIADGLHFMHTQTPAIIHQDLKPLNVMVSHVNDLCNAKQNNHVGNI